MRAGRCSNFLVKCRSAAPLAGVRRAAAVHTASSEFSGLSSRVPRGVADFVPIILPLSLSRCQTHRIDSSPLRYFERSTSQQESSWCPSLDTALVTRRLRDIPVGHLLPFKSTCTLVTSRPSCGTLQRRLRSSMRVVSRTLRTIGLVALRPHHAP